jgi:hypothetical protein
MLQKVGYGDFTSDDFRGMTGCNGIVDIIG